MSDYRKMQPFSSVNKKGDNALFIRSCILECRNVNELKSHTPNFQLNRRENHSILIFPPKIELKREQKGSIQDPSKRQNKAFFNLKEAAAQVSQDFLIVLPGLISAIHSETTTSGGRHHHVLPRDHHLVQQLPT